MKNQSDIQFEFDVPATADKVYSAIGKPSEWWIRSIEGSATAQGDSFTASFGGEDFVRFTVAEAQPGRRIVWHVDDCFLHFLEDKTEWTGTDVIFDLAPSAHGTNIKMVHRGLTPEVECYEMCNSGWEGHLLTGLRQLITEGVGLPPTE